MNTARLDQNFDRERLLASPLDALMAAATTSRDKGHGNIQTWSRKVFIPLTQLCRDVCHYCTFAHAPLSSTPAYLDREAVLKIARAGAAAGCTEALFTLGEKPELRYPVARKALTALGHESTIAYLVEACELVLRETGLLPHVNPGTLNAEELARLRRVSVSQGLMLESAADRLCLRGGPHFGSPDKHPAVRVETIRLAGELGIPFTTGLLIGIGETRAERIDALLALEALQRTYGHIQEVIIQNFRAKPDTKMAKHPEPPLEELLWTIAVARLVFGPSMNIQAPPNLSPGECESLIAAGINDWGGISPVTIDHVNPEAPWPHIAELRKATEASGKALVPRLPIYPEFARDPTRWLDPSLLPAAHKLADAGGFAREDDWLTGTGIKIPQVVSATPYPITPQIAELIARARAGDELSEAEITALFAVRGSDFAVVCGAADRLRHEICGDDVSYVVTRNINYTNVCSYRCGFCAFSKGKSNENLRGKPYDLELEEIGRRVTEAWQRGATEVCLQGGIHPAYTGESYIELLQTVRRAAPQIHIHAFSPLEISQGAATLGLGVDDYLRILKQEGLGTLPGTAAEILDDEVRAIICPDKLTTDEWLEVVETAHGLGLRTTSTIMFGHVEETKHWARHLLRIRRLQQRTGGFTEFVPLPFVAREAPLYRKGRTRLGPTFREAVLMHAVARLVLYPLLSNVQVSWVKMGREGALRCLGAGANDLGGTLMNESISRAAGAEHGQEFPPAEMEALIRSAGRHPRLRTTTYSNAPEERWHAAHHADELLPVVLSPVRDRRPKRSVAAS